jgi:hypothetical protein
MYWLYSGEYDACDIMQSQEKHAFFQEKTHASRAIRTRP